MQTELFWGKKLKSRRCCSLRSNIVVLADQEGEKKLEDKNN